MRLDVASFAVEEIEFGPRTALVGRTLVVDRDEIRQMVLPDPRIADVEVHLARPGESVRIINGLDVFEPRWKIAGPGGVFPGFVARPTAAGEGTTHRLAGVALVEASPPVPGELTHFREQIIDMAGPGAELSPFGRTLNLVLHCRPALEFFPEARAETRETPAGRAAVAEYQRAMTLAATKVAARLAEASAGGTPDEVETFELAPSDGTLPRVVCLYHYRGTYLYGAAARLPFGALIHPNEAFEGALVGWSQSYRCTYWDQNNEALRQLCRQHGKTLSFAGCVLFGDVSPTRDQKERIAGAAVRLARLLGAQAALVLGVNGSNLAVDTMLAVQECERAGIKTTLIYLDVGYGADDPGFVHVVPEADAIVCTGSRDRLAPLDALRDLEEEGAFRKLHDELFTTVGNTSAIPTMRRFAHEMAPELKAAGVDGVVLTAA